MVEPLDFDARLREARGALQAGNLERAKQIYDLLVGADPNRAHLYFERGLVAHTGHDAEAAMQDYRACLRLDDTHVKARGNLGQIVRRTTTTICPRAGASVAEPDAPTFVSVLGNGHARSFTSTTLFFPLWLGSSEDLSFLTDELAAKSQDHLLAIAERLDLRFPVMLVLAESDVYSHAADAFGTNKLQAEGELGSGEKILSASALRYVGAIEALLEHLPGIQLVVLAGIVGNSAEKNALIRFVNGMLAEHCGRLGLPFVDCNDALIDPSTGLLRADLRCYPDDPHLSKEAVVALMHDVLPRFGLLPAGTLPFEWSYTWEVRIEGHRLLIWGEPYTGPDNRRHAETLAFHRLFKRGFDLMLGTLARHERRIPPSVLVPYCREGYLPLSLPIENVSRVTGVDHDLGAVVTGRRLAGYFGRPDVTFCAAGENQALAATVEPHDYVFTALRDEKIASPQALLDNLLSVCRDSVVVLSRLDWSGLARPAGGTRLIVPLAEDIGNAHWSDGTILVERRA